MVIAIDGPAGSGKSTVAKILAERLGFLYIDTGAMYRALTLKALSQEIDLKDQEELLKLARHTHIELKTADNKLQVILDGENVTHQIRTPQVTNNIFYIADNIEIRKIMVSLQRKMAEGKDVVLEGRDTTTVVFPDADIKIYLDADFKERARRRLKDFLAKGLNLILEEVEEDLRDRDYKDKNRAVGNLKIAPDAVYIDTTSMNVEEVVERIISIVDGK